MGVTNTWARGRMVSDPKLEAVLARLCDRLGGKLWKTQVVKLPYLVDLVAVHVLGRKITETQHEAWQMGVVSTGAWGLMQHDLGGEHFKVEVADYSEDARRLSVTSPPPAKLTAEEVAIVDFVAEEYGRLPAEELMALTKAINPEVPLWGQPSQQIVETEEAYQRLPGWFGEDEADAEDAQRILRAIKRDPSRLVGGADAAAFLEELAN